MEKLDEIEARSGPSAKRRLSMHSSEGADSEKEQRRRRGGFFFFFGFPLFKISRARPAKRKRRRAHLLRRRRILPPETSWLP